MSTTKKCGQHACTNDGVYRFTWPGCDEAVVCETHVKKLRAVAEAIGLSLQLIPLEEKAS